MKPYLERLAHPVPAVGSNSLIVLAAIYIMLASNQAFWSTLFQVVDVTRVDHRVFLVSVTLLVFSLLFILISLFSFRAILKPAIFILIVASSVTGYFMDAYGAIIDVNMVQNMVQTDVAEAGELATLPLFVHVFLYGILPATLIILIPVRHFGWRRALATRSLALVTIIGISATSVYYSYKDVSFIFRENRQITRLINPVYPLRSAIKYYRDRQSAEPQPLQTVFSDAHMDEQVASRNRSAVFVIVVGETARAGNFHINGYARNTTPRLEQKHVFNFSDTSSCGTSTAVSVPCIFSELGHDNYDDSRAQGMENLLDALKHAGVDVLWRDNNSGCKGVCARVATENMHHLDISDYCNEDGCYDEVLLYQLKDYIDKLEGDAVIVLHQQGSHGPGYYRRYPRQFAKFQPECATADVQNCSYGEIVNAYDNTILYTDYFLSRVIDLLDSRSDRHDTAMLYVSDHGESLGENGIYLHGLPYMLAPVEQTRVPFMIWLSKSFTEDMNIDTACLERQQSRHHSHDDILHSTLGVLGIRTRLYDPRRNIFAGCQGSNIHHNVAHWEQSGDIRRSQKM